MSGGKKIIGTIVFLAAVVLFIYGLSSMSGSNSRGGEDGGSLGAPDVRTMVTLTVMGGSAFIAGFGFRDVIGRAVAAHARSKLAAVRRASGK